MIKENLFVLIILVTSTIMPPNPDLMFYISAGFAIILGIVLRVGVQIKNKTFSWAASLVNLLITFPVCYLAYNIYITYDIGFQLQTYLFLVSFMALFIANLVEKIAKVGLTEFAQYLLKKITAKDNNE